MTAEALVSIETAEAIAGWTGQEDPYRPSPASGRSVTVVLPCLNEDASVGKCVREALAAMRATGIDGEVLVVDNGSTDASPRVAAAAGARVVVERKRGYGAALRAGVRAAKGEIVVMADADWTYDLSSVPRLVDPVLRGEADLVIGSRLCNATRRTMPFLHRWVGTPALTFLVRRAGGQSTVTDSQSGYRAFRRSTMLALGLRSRGMEYASEMLIKANQAGLRLVDIPTGYRERIGESKLNTVADGWRHLRLILTVAPHLLLFMLGAAGLVSGAVLLALGFHEPSSIVVGSMPWQARFLSGVLMLLGEHAVLVALVLNRRQALLVSNGRRFIHSKRFPTACVFAGLIVLGIGVNIDATLFTSWLAHAHNLPRFGLASLARTAIVGGASLAGFGVLMRMAHEQLADTDLDTRVYAEDDAAASAGAGLTLRCDQTPASRVVEL